jgi:hypothetical protein
MPCNLEIDEGRSVEGVLMEINESAREALRRKELGRIVRGFLDVDPMGSFVVLIGIDDQQLGKAGPYQRF